MSRWIPVGSVRRAHGLRGQLRIQLLLEDITLLAPGSELQVGEKVFFVRNLGPAPGGPDLYLLALEEVSDRNAAEALKGLSISMRSDELRAGNAEGVVLLADLEGLEALDATGASLGPITAVSVLAGQSMAHLGAKLIPLDGPFLVSVDFEAGTAQFDLPGGLLEVQDS